MTDFKRKRSLFSCDYCKTKKIACHRVDGNPSIYEPCETCSALKVECKTTIKRKKRKFNVDSISKVNNEYMIKILGTMYPDVDFNNTNALKSFYESMKIKKSSPASLDGTAEIKTETPNVNEDTDYESDDENFEVIYSGKSIEGIASTASTFGSNQGSFDRVIYDNDGVSHFMGSFGFTNLVTMLLNNFIRLTKKKDISCIRFVQSMNERGSIMSSFSEKTDLMNLDTTQFPMICYFTKEEAAFYVNRYSHYNHRLLGGINQEKFQSIYDKFWNIHMGLIPANSLTYAQYCCIYAVWINGISIELHPDAKMQETYEIMDKYINLIKVLLSDIFLSPSPDGILCLLLLSFFFERNMQMETAYILCQTAVCHAMTCGFHRESIANNETSYLWWSLFDREVKLCLFLGRSSSIPLKQVSLKYEQRFRESLDVNSKHNLLMTELNKLVYTMLSHRTRLPSSGKHLSEHHIKEALQMDGLFEKYYTKLPEKVKSYKFLSCNDAELLVGYYFVKMSSTVPFMLYPMEYLSKYSDSVLKLVESTMKAAFACVEFLGSVENFDFDQIEFNETYTSSYAMLCFIAGTLFYKIGCNALPKDKKPGDIAGTCNRIKVASKRLNEYNEKRIGGSRGTMRIRRHWVRVLYEDQQLFLSSDKEDIIQKLRDTILSGDIEEQVLAPFNYITSNNIANLFETTFDNFFLGETLISEIFDK